MALIEIDGLPILNSMGGSSMANCSTGRSAGVALARGVAASARPAGKMPQLPLTLTFWMGKSWENDGT